MPKKKKVPFYPGPPTLKETPSQPKSQDSLPDTLGHSLFKSVTIEVGKHGDYVPLGQTHKPCSGGCGRLITTEEITHGIAFQKSYLCFDCSLKQLPIKD